MQIEKLTVRNMIAARNIDIRLNTPITLICGSNEAGKSSICEGIKHALTGESTRVSLKKDYKHLVNDGGDVGYTYLEFDGGKQACITLPNGTHELKEQLHPALPYVLDPELFSRLSEDDRRRFILSLSSVKNDMQSVKAELLKRGCDAGKVEKILPFLRSGFDAGYDESKNKAKEAKTAWRTVTGETYGEKKAAEWKAVAPEVDQQSVVDAGKNVASIDAEITIENVKLGSAQASFNAHQKNSVEISNLKEMAGKIERIQKKLETDRKEHQSWAEKVEETKRAAMGSAPGNVALKCPECAAELVFNGNNLAKRDGDLRGDEDAAVKLPQYEKSLEVLTKSIVNGDRDLASAMYAKERLEAIDKESTESLSEESINQIKAKIASLKLDLNQAKNNLDTLNNSARQAKEAKEKTAKAAEYHADVQAWEVIAEALSPEGIPGQMLATAIEPINKRLIESAVDTGWKQVFIREDMSISYDCRPHGLSSVSAKWRTNAMIAEAISHVSGIKFILLDGFDVLSLEGRGELIGWLEYLAQKKEVETVIAFGTLKSLPSGLPGCIAAHWLDNGVIGELEAA